MEGLSWGLFFPLLLAALVYIGLYAAANVVDGRGDTERAENLRDLSYGLVLLVAVYTVVLLVIALIYRPGELFDALRIVLVVGVFFLLLLLVIFAVFELIGSRSRRRSQP